MLHPKQDVGALHSYASERSSCTHAARSIALPHEARSSRRVPLAFRTSATLLKSLFSIMLSHFKSLTPTRAWSNEAWSKNLGGPDLKLGLRGLPCSRLPSHQKAMLFTSKTKRMVSHMLLSKSIS